MFNDIYGAFITQEDRMHVMQALSNMNGPNKYYYCEEFQLELARYHNRKYCLLTSNCTSAISIILEAIGVKDKQVLVPEITWCASAFPASRLGAEVIFCDIDRNTWCLDVDSVERSITLKTAAIIVVDLYGNMPNMEDLLHIANTLQIPVIEDFAEALGSTYKSMPAGSFGTSSVCSFHRSKTITTGAGGCLLLDDDDLYRKCVRLRDLGRDSNTAPYRNDIVAHKYIMSNMQAALGYSQFLRLDKLVQKKRDIFFRYKKNLENKNLQWNPDGIGVYNSVWGPTFIHPDQYKEDVIANLSRLGVETRPFFYPLSDIPAYKQRAYYERKNPIAYSISPFGINLPSNLQMSMEDVDKICDILNKVL